MNRNWKRQRIVVKYPLIRCLILLKYYVQVICGRIIVLRYQIKKMYESKNIFFSNKTCWLIFLCFRYCFPATSDFVDLFIAAFLYIFVFKKKQRLKLYLKYHMIYYWAVIRLSVRELLFLLFSCWTQTLVELLLLLNCRWKQILC